MLNKIRNFARNKKGVSQFVELIVIIGLTVGVGAIAVKYVTDAIKKAKTAADGEKLPEDTVPDLPASGGGVGA